MARPKFKARVDMSIPALRREVMSTAGALEGMYEVEFRPVRETRSTRANAYYWAAVVKPFFDLLSSQEPAVSQAEQAHIEIKRNVLGTRVVRIRGVVSRIVPTTHDMDTAAFMDYVERARHWLREQVGIETLDPGEFGIPTEDPDPNWRETKREQQKQLTAANAAETRG